ncbi:unnamed protein product [Pleuronectes platessa]|uniref:Uncharacterized protein n=1 Tax=Pleuronectes platessa TaxID=8262 RepID=A0A9N7V591_PLEPL|nr:unnamed protein product [Pleuronectes platessa]
MEGRREGEGGDWRLEEGGGRRRGRMERERSERADRGSDVISRLTLSPLDLLFTDEEKTFTGPEESYPQSPEDETVSCCRGPSQLLMLFSLALFSAAAASCDGGGEDGTP